MSKKTLNAANLAALGPERLADLLIEVSTGSAEIKRRLRLELSHNLGPAELAHDVRKRLTSIRRSKGYVGWRKRRALIRDLQTQADMITQKIAPDAPSEAFDLLWQFTQMAPSVFERVDDSRGEVVQVFATARAQFAEIGPRAQLDPSDLARRVWEAVGEDAYGAFDGIIELLAPTLGEAGLVHLKAAILAEEETGQAPDETHAALQFLRELRGTSGQHKEGPQARLRRVSLQQVARAQGDVDGYIAQYRADDLARPQIAAEVAEILLEQDRAQEALDILVQAQDGGARNPRWDRAYTQCLTALGQAQAAQRHRWEVFTETLDIQSLRDHLKQLPDFDDIEAEEAAKAHALTHHSAPAALVFFLGWPDLAGAAQLTERRIAELDIGIGHILTPAADALRDRHALAATLLWRVVIDDILWERRTADYATAADHLMDCTAADIEITDYQGFPTHSQYVAQLRAQFAGRSKFWARVR